ncbi:MAG: hypothetical protein EON58_01460 [Alphaproteobacteria bacterium]|nr:MAG: hypothetical protein EON58_01460 [Alphaproteobacteria bacterium]
MLKPVHRVGCSPALAACQQLMKRFAIWLCQPATSAMKVSEQGLQPPVLATAIEANWLWSFLQRTEAGQTLLSRAQTLAGLPAVQKAALAAWVQAVGALPAYFQPGAGLWPVGRPLGSKQDWNAFKELMESFYVKGFADGLPYKADGIPTDAGGVTYADYVRAFRSVHRLNPDPNAREVCVLCGGHLGDTPHVDHWVTKRAFPLLSVCADNLLLICSTCNEAPNKGKKPVHSGGSFSDWFHPYLRAGNAHVQLDYVLPAFAIQCSAAPADQPKAANLDTLLNLSTRWTREFKAEYAKQQDVLNRRERRRLALGQARHSLAEIQQHLQKWAADLSLNEPHYEVHSVLGHALMHPARTQALLTELSAVR